jgi:glycosyltransferase involved in cell wall biosynthesis
MISHMWNSSAAANKNRYDIIHIHSTDPCLLAWKPKARFGTIATSHGQAYLRKKWGLIPRTMSKIAERFYIHLPQKITSVSKPLADYYQEKYKQGVHYIPNGIDFREKPSEALLDKWELKARQFLFCSAGRVERTKGLHTLFEAYAVLDTDLPLVIAGGGSGSDPDYLEQLTRNKPEGVLFTGFLTGDEYYALYAHARVFVFPSEYEAMSMTLLEGLSFGMPTVYSDIPENLAVAGGLAYSFRVSDADSLANQLGTVLGQYDDAVGLGQKAQTVIRKNYDWTQIALKYHQLYLDMAASN